MQDAQAITQSLTDTFRLNSLGAKNNIVPFSRGGKENAIYNPLEAMNNPAGDSYGTLGQNSALSQTPLSADLAEMFALGRGGR